MVAEPTLIGRKEWSYIELCEFDDHIRRELHEGEIFQQTLAPPAFKGLSIELRQLFDLNKIK